MKTILIKIATVILLFVPSVSGATCPLGGRETELGFSRVMQNFGRLLIRADSVVRKGQSEAWQLTKTEMEEALTGIEGAIACAEASLQSSQPDMLPQAARKLTGDALTLYKKNYDKHMTEFKVILLKYQDLFQKNLAVDPAQRDFSPGVVIERQIREKANESHQAL